MGPRSHQHAIWRQRNHAWKQERPLVVCHPCRSSGAAPMSRGGQPVWDAAARQMQMSRFNIGVSSHSQVLVGPSCQVVDRTPTCVGRNAAATPSPGAFTAHAAATYTPLQNRHMVGWGRPKPVAVPVTATLYPSGGGGGPTECPVCVCGGMGEGVWCVGVGCGRTNVMACGVWQVW